VEGDGKGAVLFFLEGGEIAQAEVVDGSSLGQGWQVFDTRWGNVEGAAALGFKAEVILSFFLVKGEVSLRGLPGVEKSWGMG